jgi:hypothetical protein
VNDAKYIGPVMLLLPYFTGPNLRCIPDPQVMTQGCVLAEALFEMGADQLTVPSRTPRMSA